jgi:hypothetical protein
MATITTTVEPMNEIVFPTTTASAPKIDFPGASELPVKKSASSVEMETPATTLTPSEPGFYGEYEELFDADVIEDILRDEGFSKETRKRLSAYKKSREHGNRVKVRYYYGKGCGALRVGRVFCKKFSGLQAFPRDVRDPLNAKHYWDLDMENAHYWIMRNFCEKNNLKHEKIAYYCDNREACLNVVSSNRSRAKTAFLKIAYGGNVKLGDENAEDDGEEPEGDITLIKECQKEIATCITYVKGAYPAITKIAVEKCRNKKEWADKKGKKIYWNADFTALALVLQTEEHKCLEKIEEYLKANGRVVDLPIHDGGRVRKLDNETAFPTELIKGAEEYVKEKTGFTLKLKIKPLPAFVPSATTTPVDIIDDEFASRRFVELMGEHIVREEDTVYYFNPDTGMWETGDTAYRCAVRKHKAQLIFKIITPDGDEKIINYGGCEKNVSAMKKWITTCIPNGRFISDNMDTSIGKLLFKDGIYDFTTDTFTTEFDPKIVFNKRITRNAPKRECRNETTIAKVNKMLFEDAFDEGDGKLAGQYLRKNLCIGLVGDYRRKKFYACLGDANCGKGFTTTAFKKTFEGYVDEWNANELKYNSRNGQDECRKMAWVKELIGCRLAFSNEFRMDRTPIDGNLLKAVSSGGDQIKGRGHQEGSMPFVNRATMFLFGNDFGNITPKDSGIQERCRFVRYRLRFVSGEPSSPEERKADPEAKDYFDKDEYRDALFWVMVDTYQNMEADEKRKGGVVVEPDCVKEETKDWVGDGGDEDFEVFIKRKYDITGLATDSVPSRDIVDYITTECKVSGLSPNKIGRLLTKIIQAVNKDCPRDRNPVGEEVGKQRQGIKIK